MKYFNKDYANFIVSDEKEKQLIKERNTRMNWQADSRLKLENQKRLVKNGWILVSCWMLIALCNLALAAYNYNKTNAITFGTILYGICGIFGIAASVLYYYEIKKARSEIAGAKAMA